MTFSTDAEDNRGFSYDIKNEFQCPESSVYNKLGIFCVLLWPQTPYQCDWNAASQRESYLRAVTKVYGPDDLV